MIREEEVDELSASSANRSLVQLLLIFLPLLGVDIELGEEVVWRVHVAESLQKFEKVSLALCRAVKDLDPQR
jgi:hypothetical protein